MHHPIAPPLWNTAAIHDTADTADCDLAALGQHLKHCKGTHGHLFALQCAAERMSGFATARFITTLVTVTLLLGVLALVL
jgi:hypothetical protein